MSNENITIIEKPTGIDDFLRLREISGLSTRNREAAEKALPLSVYGIHIEIDNKVVAMGRIVGDGYLNFHIVDVAVDPGYQGRGLGRLIMEKILDFLQSRAQKESYISLLADEPDFYKKFGFVLSGPECEGMVLKL